MRIYENFLKINPRDNIRFSSFINDNCPKTPLIENLRKRGLSVNIARHDCGECNLCKKSTFLNSRQNLKKLIEELNYSEIFLLPGKLNSLSDKYLNIKLMVVENAIRDHEVKLKYYNNLWQKIVYDLILHFTQKLNEIGIDSKYFSQIAEILISTSTFISDMKNIRDNYLEPQTSGKNDFDFYRKPNISKKLIYKEIVNIREKYLLSERWESWIEKMLYYDFERNKNIIFRYIPSGRILKKMKLVSTNNNLQLVNEPVLVGDETKREIKDFQNAYHVNINYTPSKRKPILDPDFKKYLRWYKARDAGIRYRDIFDDELTNYFEDWIEYREFRDGENGLQRILSDGRTERQWEKTAFERMKYGVHKLRNRIFKEYK